MVCDSSVIREYKGALNPEVGTLQHCVVNLIDGVVEVYTDPAEGKYASVHVARRGETIGLSGGLGAA